MQAAETSLVHTICIALEQNPIGTIVLPSSVLFLNGIVCCAALSMGMKLILLCIYFSILKPCPWETQHPILKNAGVFEI